jgi:hypothetical protein
MHRILIMPPEGIVASLVDEMSERFRAVSRPDRPF